ncbi:MAG: glycine dehydrogenase (aminomethyl-transferring) [Elusimicrobia bacterium]|nr:MAG: glycine dehydrogenase (aminomethyl-transferring) [Elusimicrobiota bacterium]
MTTSAKKTSPSLDHPDAFVDRHIGPSPDEIEAMLETVGYDSLDSLMDAVVPKDILAAKPLDTGKAKSESDALAQLREIAGKNKVFRSYIGTGYHGTIVPAVIQRNILENPGWYTQYTPYQAEIAQGRLEALLNFQTMVIDLTGLEVANSSMLDESTSAAEAMTLAFNTKGSEQRKTILVSSSCHPQTIDLLKTRAWPLGLEILVADPKDFSFEKKPFAAIVQYPTTDGRVEDYAKLAEDIHAVDGLLIVAADLLSLTLLRAPGEFGADIAVGSTQRFGVPLGFGGPHAGFFATKSAYQRQMPGRIVGVSKDQQGRPALRLALQTREQHIRRERATSNICTAQVLLAVMASMYAVYHGPDGLREIAARIRRFTLILKNGLARLGHDVEESVFFDTIRIVLKKEIREIVLGRAAERKINLRLYDDGSLGITLDETVGPKDAADLFEVFAIDGRVEFTPESVAAEINESIPAAHNRQSKFLTHPIFHKNRSETEMLRYINRLQTRDLSLTYSMIPLGSCTMKLNATTEMIPVTWRKFAKIHPFAPSGQTKGYGELLRDLENMLAEITGFSAVSLQPNAGSQGEYAGLLVIKKHHESNGEGHRHVCLIPQSAHGTNPASAAMAGMKIVVIKCDDEGNIDVADLKAKAEEHAKDLSALMITYPSTHGVFEPTIKEICSIIHDNGGQVYLDGANLNAQVGYCRPGDYGGDVCHLNLHKTFCIPHGGGGPGMGPIAVAAHLAPYLPSHPLVKTGGTKAIGAISAAPWGSPAILPITWMYIKMMGADGLRKATQLAILNANYIAKKLDEHYPVLYKGTNALVAHECIVDLRPFKAASGILVDDVARRLMDHGFHAPTMSWPVMGTMMIEPTESESKEELDIFITAMIAIRMEIQKIQSGELDKIDNPLKNAPHTAAAISVDEWSHHYGREAAAYPSPWTREHKFWPPVGKIDAPYGDRNLVCACPPLDSY